MTALQHRHLAIDLDDVVVDLVGGILSAIKKEFGVELQETDINQWDLHPLLDPIVGRSWWAWLRDREWLWAQFPAVDGAIGSLDILRRRGHYLEAITSKPTWAEHNVFKWLGLWRPPFQRITIVGPDDRKVDFTDATIIVDDKPSNCQGFIDEGRAALLFSRPHNLTAILNHKVQRVADWKAVREALL